MIHAYSPAQIRAAEAVALHGFPGGALMKRAAHEVAAVVIQRVRPVVGSAVLLLVGPGNNGGDALFAGAVLRRRGMAVTAVLLAPDRAHSGGLQALRRAGGSVVPASSPRMARLCAAADVVIDGLLGLSARPQLSKDMRALVETANQAGALRVAVDIPTGVDPDSGRADFAFRADVTVTFGGMKTALLLAGRWAGQVVVADLGFATSGATTFSLTDFDVRHLLPAPGPDDDKFSVGVPGIVAGSLEYPGAAVLCVGAAVSARAGLVRYAGPQAAAVLARWPEVVAARDVYQSGRVQAWVVGPGLGTDMQAEQQLRAVLESQVPVLIDADGLTLLAAQELWPQSLLARLGRITVLTPHDREFGRLFPDLDLGDRLESVRTAAARSGATVLLKGYRTVVADPDGRVAVNTTGSGWLATAGSGDVLSGVIGSLLAGGLGGWEAAAVGAHLHGRAGERAELDAAAGASALLTRIRVPEPSSSWS